MPSVWTSALTTAATTRAPLNDSPNVASLGDASPAQPSEVQYGTYTMVASPNGDLSPDSNMPPSARCGFVVLEDISHGWCWNRSVQVFWL